jgi:pyruvate carboxylase subunit B
MIYHVTIGERTLVVELGPGHAVVDGRRVEVDLADADGGSYRSLIVDGASHAISARRPEAESWDLHLRGRRLRAQVVDERTRAIREMTGEGTGPVGPKPIRAPMPGMVVRIEVQEGDTVAAGQGVVIVEAMKMENELKAEGEGLVTKVHVAEGQAVEKDQLLVDLAPLDSDEDAGEVA